MRVLRAQGIDFLLNGDGRPLVLLSSLEPRGGAAPASQQPDFSSFSAPKR
jgi:hypothetical protein